MGDRGGRGGNGQGEVGSGTAMLWNTRASTPQGKAAAIQLANLVQRQAAPRADSV
jgi:hypothetical protein